ncbi:Fucose 4-O-acetylase [Lachnospiraceae bacterium XBD2001]|nr:Fucose 4-O-acetylase [Lachnospiraceae bacterium XBD2001]
MPSKQHNIDYRFKILYAIGIIMVVSGHCGGGINVAGEWFPYGGMHLPLFVFCSGYFYKDSSESAYSRYICKKFRSLIIPFWIYNVVYGLFVQMIRPFGFNLGGDFTWQNLFIEPFTNGHQFLFNMGGWFVVPLFLVEVYNVTRRKICGLLPWNTSEWGYFLFDVFLGIAGNQLAIMGYNTGWWLTLVRMLYFLPFYELGILYNRKLEAYDKKIPSFPYFCFVFAVKLIIIFYLGRVPAYGPSWCNDFKDGPFMPIVIGVLGIMFVLRFACILEPVIGRSRWINLVADNTFSIMMNQFLGFMLVKTVFSLFNLWANRCIDFNWEAFQNDIWYYFIPRGISNTLIIYLIVGIAFPIFIQKILDRMKSFVFSQKEKR